MSGKKKEVVAEEVEVSKKEEPENNMVKDYEEEQEKYRKKKEQLPGKGQSRYEKQLTINIFVLLFTSSVVTSLSDSCIVYEIEPEVTMELSAIRHNLFNNSLYKTKVI